MATIDPETQGGAERLPIGQQLFEAARRLYDVLSLEAGRQLAQQGLECQHLDQYMDLKKGRLALVLPGLGVDSIDSLSFATLPPWGDDREQQLVCLDMNLFEDGSPRVLEGDLLGDPSENHYRLVLSGMELPPTLVQVEQIINFDIASWNQATKHHLSEAESESILALLSSGGLQVDMDEIVSGARPIHKLQNIAE